MRISTCNWIDVYDDLSRRQKQGVKQTYKQDCVAEGENLTTNCKVRQKEWLQSKAAISLPFNYIVKQQLPCSFKETETRCFNSPVCMSEKQTYKLDCVAEGKNLTTNGKVRQKEWLYPQIRLLYAEMPVRFVKNNPERVENFLKMHFCLYFCTEASEKNVLKSGNVLKTGISVYGIKSTAVISLPFNLQCKAIS